VYKNVVRNWHVLVTLLKELISGEKDMHELKMLKGVLALLFV
jgi:hypothetical protein